MKFIHIAALTCLAQSINIRNSNQNSLHHGDSDEEKANKVVKTIDPPANAGEAAKIKANSDDSLYNYGENPVDELNRELENKQAGHAHKNPDINFGRPYDHIGH